MNTTSRLKKEIIVLVGGVVLLYLAARLCGITAILFASPTSSFGGIILLFACRSLVASLLRPSGASAREEKT